MSASLCVFTLTAILGLMIAIDLFRGKALEPWASKVHGITALVGSAFAIGAAFTGETRIYLNIAMAVVIIILGLFAVLRRHKTGVVPKAILGLHITLALACYLLLAASVLINFDAMAMMGIDVKALQASLMG